MNKATLFHKAVPAVAAFGVAALSGVANAQVTVPAAFTIDYEDLATAGMTAGGAAITAAVVVLGAIWAIKMGLRLFHRIAKV